MNDLRRAADLSVLFRGLERPLLAFFLARFGTAELAEEARQDVYLKFTEAGYETEDPPARAIIFAIARNLFRDHLRRLRREREAGFVLDDTIDSEVLEQVPAQEKSHDEILIARAHLSQVMAALNALPARSRDAFLLHRVQGLKYSEIAVRLGVSVSRIEKMIARALFTVMRVKKEAEMPGEL